MNLGLNVIFGKDFSDSMLLLTGLAAMQPNPKDYALSTDSFYADPYALMLRRDDPAFKKLVDDTITALYRSGETRASTSAGS